MSSGPEPDAACFEQRGLHAPPGPLNLLKSVPLRSIESLETLADCQRRWAAQWARMGGPPAPAWDLTGRGPAADKRREIVAGGGSIYWMIGGVMTGRQRIAGFRDCVDTLDPFAVDAIRPFCCIFLYAGIIPVSALPRRPFRGWRYLRGEDAPADLPDEGETALKDDQSMPASLRRDLVEAGLI